VYFFEVVNITFGGGEKRAVTVVLLVIVNWHVPIPVQEVLSGALLLQPMKVWLVLASAVAERYMVVPKA